MRDPLSGDRYGAVNRPATGSVALTANTDNMPKDLVDLDSSTRVVGCSQVQRRPLMPS